MFLAFQRTHGSATVAMLCDDGWDQLKLAMCNEWQVEHEFNHFGGWSSLVKGQVVVLGNDLFRLIDTDRSPTVTDVFGAPRYEIVLGERT